MARASRSSKKLPAFDPSELSDLIFSPAVGRGVGSHLIETAEPPPALIPSSEFEQDVLTSESEPVLNKSSLTTVANSDLPTTASKFLPTVDMSDPPPVASYDMSTAVMLDPEASFD